MGGVRDCVRERGRWSEREGVKREEGERGKGGEREIIEGERGIVG